MLRTGGSTAEVLEDLAGEDTLHAALLRAQSDLDLGLVVVEGERITHANDAFVRITGRDREALDQLSSFFELVPADLQPTLRKGWQLRLEGRTTTDRFEGAVLRPDGTRVEVEVAVKLLPGRVLRLAAVVRDVTERKRVEEAHRALLRQLQEERLLLECIIQSLPDAVFVGDRNGLRLANAPALEQLGYGDLEEVNRNLDRLAERLQVRDADTGRLLAPEEELFGLALEGRASERQVVLRDAHTGEDRVFRSAAAPIEVDGRVLGAVVVNTDITARRRAEEEVRAAKARLEELGRMRTQFFNAVAHELRTPMTPVLLQLELLRSASLEPPHRAAVDVVERAMDRLNRLLDDVLDAARVESGKLSVTPEPVDLPRLVREAERVFAAAAGQAGVRLVVDGPEALQVQADPQRLAQVLFNLLSNAVKFTPHGGEVRVVVRAEDNHARVEVRDSGRGLRPEEAEQLFRPFAQLPAEEGAPRRGTGLGLFISKGIVEQHGGRLGVSSAGVGHGSAFWFTLPLPAFSAPA